MPPLKDIPTKPEIDLARQALKEGRIVLNVHSAGNGHEGAFLKDGVLFTGYFTPENLINSRPRVYVTGVTYNEIIGYYRVR